MIKSSVKLSKEGTDFLKKLRLNRIKANTDEDILSYSDLLEVVAKYFKANNDKYLELVKVKGVKNA